MKPRIALLFLIVLAVLLGFWIVQNISIHAKALEVDARYIREIHFEFIGVTIPIIEDAVFVRIDDPVSDLEAHQEELLNELGVISKKKRYTNLAKWGRSMHLRFADGKECTFIWVLKRPDDQLMKSSFEHEKFHALCRTCPGGIGDLSAAISERGFNLDLATYEEELSATIVQILSLHLQGVPLEDISGSEYVVQAVRILLDNKSNKPMDNNA